MKKEGNLSFWSKNLSKIIQSKRRELGLDQKDFAKMIGKNPSYAKKLEDKNIFLIPKLSTLSKISDALNVSLKDLVEKMIEKE